MNLGKLNCQCNYWLPTPLLCIEFKLSAIVKNYLMHKCDFIDFMTPLCIMLCGVLTLLTKNRCYLQKSRVKLILRARKCSYPVFQSTTAISSTRVSIRMSCQQSKNYIFQILHTYIIYRNSCFAGFLGALHALYVLSHFQGY